MIIETVLETYNTLILAILMWKTLPITWNTTKMLNLVVYASHIPGLTVCALMCVGPKGISKYSYEMNF